jgi:amino acid transporter
MSYIHPWFPSLPKLTAAAVIVEFWSTISPGVWITVFGLLLVISNLLFIRIYGEMEFTFASLKIMLIVGLNIMVLIHHIISFNFS